MIGRYSVLEYKDKQDLNPTIFHQQFIELGNARIAARSQCRRGKPGAHTEVCDSQEQIDGATKVLARFVNVSGHAVESKP